MDESQKPSAFEEPNSKGVRHPIQKPVPRAVLAERLCRAYIHNIIHSPRFGHEATVAGKEQDSAGFYKGPIL